MARDEEWFVGLFRRHFVPLNAYCVRRVGAVDASDAVSRVFAIAWDRRDSMPRGADERSWLFGVARNVLRHHWRSTARSRRLVEKVSALRPTPYADVETIVVERAEHENVRRALSRLTESDQEILMLAAWEGLSQRKIAETTGLSLAAVEKRLARAKARLAHQYEATEASRLLSPMRRQKGGRDR
ncbi:MAG: RNA polymerase sigma factor [Acidimicrobiia bacterium]